jgi:hypothetical protein
LQVKNFVEQVVAGIIYSFDLELGPAEEATVPVSLSLWSLTFRDEVTVVESKFGSKYIKRMIRWYEFKWMLY